MQSRSNDDFAATTTAFSQWLRQVGVNLSPAIEIADLRSQAVAKGRGVVTTRRIDADHVLFSIPRSALLTAQTSDLYQGHPWFRQHVEAGILDPWSALILALLYETIQTVSRWRPYLEVLPRKADFNTLMFWTDAQLAELQASSVRSKIGRESAEASFRDSIIPIVASHRDVFGLAGLEDSQLEALLINRLHVLASTIMAYAFDLEPAARTTDEDGYATDEELEDLPKAMVPLADTLNADAERNNARLFYQADGTLEMRALCEIHQGEELLNDYGSLPRTDLLRRYGYVTDNYAKYDVVEIPTSLFVQEAKEKYGMEDDRIAERLEQLFGGETENFPDGFDLFRENMSDFQPQDVFPIVHLITSSKPNANMQGQGDRELLTYLATVLLQRRQQYLTSIEEDRRMLEQLGPSGLTENSRLVMAITIRLGEKEILEEASLKLAAMLAEIRDEENNDRPKKRRRHGA